MLLTAFTASPANATALADGTYLCSTGDPTSETTGIYTITTDGSEVTVSNANCTGVVEIPAGVTTIGSDTFFNKAITAITLPASVTTIGYGAFMNTQITTINMPNVTFIDDYAFSGATLLTSVTIPAGVTVIREYAFAYTFALTSITIPSNVTTIEPFAFTASGLTSIEIPASVSTIGEGAFSGAGALTAITVATGNTSYEASVHGVLFNKPPTTLLAYPAGRVGPYVVPAGVTRIGIQAFGSSKVTSVSLPDGLVEIGTQAFSRTDQLTSLEIPRNVTTLGMGEGVFDYAYALSSITVSENNSSFTSIDGVLFNKLRTKLLVYPNGKTANSYTVPSGVNVIGGRAFMGAPSLTSVVISSSVSSVEQLAFYCTQQSTNYFFLGHAPSAEDATFDCGPRGQKAYIKTGATGFSANESIWNGLRVSVVDHFMNYDSNGGSAVGPGGFTTGGDVSEPTAPTRTDHSFVGWSRTNGGSPVVFPYAPGGTSDVTLFANWQADSPPTVDPPVVVPPVVPPADKTPPVDLIAQAAAADLATRTVQAKSKFAGKALASRVGVITVSPKAKVTFSVSKASKKICAKSGSSLKTLTAGNCVVTFTVQEPKPKKGKKPKATKTIKTLVVQ
jgi:uncharacterized repeat protein (TIGR02543 family)